MAGINKIKQRLVPLVTDAAQEDSDISFDHAESYMVSDEGTFNLRTQSLTEYDINSEGLQFRKNQAQFRRSAPLEESPENRERHYKCASRDMQIFDTIGFGASSVVRKAIHVPTHRIVALKRINVFEKDKRNQLLREIRTLCDAPRAAGLVEFYGAFYSPDSGQISICLEYMDGGSLADLVRKKGTVPENILSAITRKVLQGLTFLHGKRRMVHRDIKPANLLLNLNGEPKITDFGISAGLDNSIAMCHTFVGTVTYMSPERINNEDYSFPADIWSLGLTLLECGTGEFPYSAAKGPINLMLQVIEDPSPSPPADKFSSEFIDFVDRCLAKTAQDRPTAEQLLSHPFITKHLDEKVDLPSFIHSVFDPTERLKDLSDLLTVHYYLLFDGPDEHWPHMESLYLPSSTLKFGNNVYLGSDAIFEILTEIRNMLVGEKNGQRLVRCIESLDCCAFGHRGVMVSVAGSLVAGTCFVPPTSRMQMEGLSHESLFESGCSMGSFNELFVLEPGLQEGSYMVSKQELAIRSKGEI